MFKNAKVVMPPTNEKANEGVILFSKDSTRLSLANRVIHGNKIFDVSVNYSNGNYQPQDLYILSLDEFEIIKDGDWVIPNDYNNSVWQFKQDPCPLPFWGCADNCKKVIATTDKALKLPEPSSGFIKKYIEKYNSGNPIVDIMVEYVDNGYEELMGYDYTGQPFWKWKERIELYVDKNNNITIRPLSISNKLDSEEFYNLMQSYRIADIRDQESVVAKFEYVKNWIKNNI